MTPPADTLDAWAADAAPAPDKLDRLRAGAARLRAATLSLVDLKESVETRTAEINKLRQRELPDLFAEAGTDGVGLPAEGNMPAVDVKLTPFYHASIPADAPLDTQVAAFRWLRESGNEGLIKNTFTVYLDRGDDQKAAWLRATLDSAQISYDRAERVHHATLTAFVRTEVEAGRAVPLDLLGATVGTMAKLTERK